MLYLKGCNRTKRDSRQDVLWGMIIFCYLLKSQVFGLNHHLCWVRLLVKSTFLLLKSTFSLGLWAPSQSAEEEGTRFRNCSVHPVLGGGTWKDWKQVLRNRLKTLVQRVPLSLWDHLGPCLTSVTSFAWALVAIKRVVHGISLLFLSWSHCLTAPVANCGSGCSPWKMLKSTISYEFCWWNHNLTSW